MRNKTLTELLQEKRNQLINQIEDVSILTREQYEERRAELYNKSRGKLNEIDGYNCRICFNKGDIQYIENGYVYSKKCECMKARKSIINMRKSGLENVIRQYTFDSFKTGSEWQENIKQKALNYLKENEINWFFIGGNPGCGKTHLCTAICREYLAQGKAVKYMLWKEESTKLKSIINEPEYDRKIGHLKRIDILYIDDFFKPIQDRNGTILNPTPADIGLAYDILDYRKHANLRTIISSERYMSEIIRIDQAIGSRIVEKANKKHIANVERNTDKNYRLKGNWFD